MERLIKESVGRWISYPSLHEIAVNVLSQGGPIKIQEKRPCAESSRSPRYLQPALNFIQAVSRHDADQCHPNLLITQRKLRTRPVGQIRNQFRPTVAGISTEIAQPLLRVSSQFWSFNLTQDDGTNRVQHIRTRSSRAPLKQTTPFRVGMWYLTTWTRLSDVTTILADHPWIISSAHHRCGKRPGHSDNGVGDTCVRVVYRIHLALKLWLTEAADSFIHAVLGNCRHFFRSWMGYQLIRLLRKTQHQVATSVVSQGDRVLSKSRFPVIGRQIQPILVFDSQAFNWQLDQRPKFL